MPAARMGRDACCRDVTVPRSLLQNAPSCTLCCCPAIKWGSSGVNQGRVWQVISSEAISSTCHWLYDTQASLCNPAAGGRQENNVHALPSTVSITLLSSTSCSQEHSTRWRMPCPLWHKHPGCHRQERARKELDEAAGAAHPGAGPCFLLGAESTCGFGACVLKAHWRTGEQLVSAMGAGRDLVECCNTETVPKGPKPAPIELP